MAKKSKKDWMPFDAVSYISDTRVLTPEERGIYMDLICQMWLNNPKGEVSGTIEELARMTNCQPKEFFLVNQKLQNRNILEVFYEEKTKKYTLFSRKQRKILGLSIIRQLSGNQGGSPFLLNQNLEFGYPKDENLDNQSSKLGYPKNSLLVADAYIERDIENKVSKDKNSNLENKKGGVGGIFPGEEFLSLPLPSIKKGAAKQLIYFSQNHYNASDEEMDSLWSVFKAQNFTGDTFYKNENDIYRHFINWAKSQKVNGAKTDNPGASKTVKPSGRSKLAESLKSDLKSIRRGEKNI